MSFSNIIISIRSAGYELASLATRGLNNDYGGTLAFWVVNIICWLPSIHHNSEIQNVNM